MRIYIAIMTNDSSIYLQDSSVPDLESGYVHLGDAGLYQCVFCGARYEEGLTYPIGDRLVLAERAVQAHLIEVHGGAARALLALGKTYTGLSDIQGRILEELFAGSSDREIARKLGGKSASTIRNHRFHLRRQAREARVFLALMNLLEKTDRGSQSFVDFHAELPVQDERVIVTTQEAGEITEKYFLPGEPPRLRRLPRKQKEILVVLNRLAQLFVADRVYSEKEVNQILAPSYEDHVTLRRYLVDYRFLARKPDGSAYWRP
jgi:hypothetical protein